MTAIPFANLGKLDREKLVRACVARCRGEGWTVRYDLQHDVWHVAQAGDRRTMGLPGLAHFTGRAAELACRKCGCTEPDACVDHRGPCWWVQYDLCSHCEITTPQSLSRMSVLAAVQQLGTPCLGSQIEAYLGRDIEADIRELTRDGQPLTFAYPEAKPGDSGRQFLVYRHQAAKP